MAIITAEIWSAWANVALSQPELQSAQRICDQVSTAIKNKLKRTIEQQTFTDLIFDAPTTPYILLGRYAPITISSFQCWLNDSAQGNPSAFDATNDLLEMYTDYRLDTDPANPLLSPGNLQRIGNIWGIDYRRRPNQLGYQFDPNRGAVKLTFQGGYEQVPEDIIEAGCLIVSMVLGLRKHGFIKGSESWNGYSYNIPGVGLMIRGLMGNPDAAGLLEPYVNYEALIG